MYRLDVHILVFLYPVMSSALLSAGQCKPVNSIRVSTCDPEKVHAL